MIEVALIGPKRLHRGTWIAEPEPWMDPPGKPKEPLIVAVAGSPTNSQILNDIAEASATKDRGNFVILINAILNEGL